MGIFDKRSKIEKLLEAIYHKNIKKVKKILDEANKNKKILELLNENGEYRDEYNWKCESYPLLLATDNNIEMVQLLIDYANRNKIILELNVKNNIGDYPLLWATLKNNIEMVKLLIDYANKNKIILELNGKRRDGCTPIVWTILQNNLEMFKLLIEYSIEKGIKLIIDENDIENVIYLNLKLYHSFHLKNISDIDNEFIRLLNNYRNENSIIKLIFTGNDSILSKMLNEQSKKENNIK